jgi:hypothetical protein
MNTYITLGLMLIGMLTSFISQAQTKISFEKANSSVQEVFKKGGSQIHMVRFKIEDKPSSSAIYEVKINDISTVDSTDFKLLKKFVVIKSDMTAGTIIEIPVEIFHDITKEDNEFLVLELKGTADYASTFKITPNERHAITIKNGEPRRKLGEPEFRIDIGTNFDFLENVSTEGIYLNLYAFEPELRTFKFLGHQTAVGIIAGVYQNRALSSDSSNVRIRAVQYTLIDSLSSIPDTASYVRNLYTGVQSEQIDQTGLYINPIFCIGKTERAAFYVGPSAELLRRRFIRETTYSLSQTDTLVRVIRPYPSTTPTTRQSDETIYEAYFSARGTLLYNIGDIDFSISATIGGVVSPRDSRGERTTPPGYYGVQFNLLELTSGINLGGEVRGFFLPNNYQPRVNIYLSKALDFSSFAKYKK